MAETEPDQPVRDWAQAVLRDLSVGPEESRGPRHAAQATTAPAPEQARPEGDAGSTAPAEGLVTDPAFDATVVTGRLRHGEPARRRAARWLRSLASTTRETAQLSELGAAARRPVSTSRRIAITSVRGGVGRTTVTLLLGAVLAARRDDAVIAVDTDPQLGSLVWRVGLRARPDPAEVARHLLSDRATGRHQLESLVPRTPGGLWVLQSTAAGGRTDVPLQVTRALARYFGVALLDCGGDLIGPTAPDAVLRVAHAAVLVVPTSVDGVRAASVTLDAATEETRARTVVALVARTPRAEGLDVAAAERLLEGKGAAVQRVPYDRHLASAAPIQPHRVAEPTVRAATALAGLALARAVG